MMINGHLIAVIPVESISRSKPHKTSAILQYAFYSAIGKAVFIRNMGKTHLFFLSGGHTAREQQEPYYANENAKKIIHESINTYDVRGYMDGDAIKVEHDVCNCCL